jgi:hypothetical protein
LSTLLVDTAPLVLLVVGTMDARLIRKHKNTALYDEDDFLNLVEFMTLAQRHVVTPQIVTETSNLIRQMGEPNRKLLSLGLKGFLAGFHELPVASHRAMNEPNYAVLGVTDAATLCALDDETTVLTADADLFGAVRRRGGQATLFRPTAGRY